MSEQFNRIVSRLTENGQYFTEKNPEHIKYRRWTGINNYGFIRDEYFQDTRENIHFFSYEFETILKQELELQNKTVKSNTYIVYEIFRKHKDSLKDLAWIIDDYY